MHLAEDSEFEVWSSCMPLDGEPRHDLAPGLLTAAPACTPVLVIKLGASCIPQADAVPGLPMHQPVIPSPTSVRTPQALIAGHSRGLTRRCAGRCPAAAAAPGPAWRRAAPAPPGACCRSAARSSWPAARQHHGLHWGGPQPAAAQRSAAGAPGHAKLPACASRPLRPACPAAACAAGCCISSRCE